MAFEFGKLPTLFGRAKYLEAQIDEFLDKVVEAGLTFNRAIDIYLDKGPCEEFEQFLKKIEEIERLADELRRDIETKLYVQTLIPELRGDVLSLLEHIDNIINIYEANLFRISIQSPDIPEEFHLGYRKLTETVIVCVESLVAAARSVFRDINAVRDHVKKVIFHESDADRISTQVQRKIFASDLDLAHKRHLAYFVEHIDELANAAEDVGDELSILTIKRKI